jgi:hypothetical protein
MHAAPATPNASVNDFIVSDQASSATPASRIFAIRRERSGGIENLVLWLLTTCRRNARPNVVTILLERDFARQG